MLGRCPTGRLAMLDLDWPCLTMLPHDTGAEEAEGAWLESGQR